MTTGPTHVARESAPEAARPAVAEAAVPSAPVPVAAGTLTVGHAEDRAEADADRMADDALSRLRGGADAHAHGPGCDHLRRTTEAALPGVAIRREVTDPPASATSSPTPSVSPTPVGPVGPVGPVAEETPVEAFDGGVDVTAKVPDTMANLLACRDADIDDWLDLTTPKGPLMTILRGPFEGDWFKAKACLAFDKWPGQRPRFSHQTALKLMTAFTVMRGKVHTKVTADTKARMAEELKKRAATLGEKSKLRKTLESEGARSAPQPTLPGTSSVPEAPLQVGYKGSVGADSVTSDVDVSTEGLNSEIAVRVYNEVFREVVGGDYDPGTVFDLNVYAMDFIHGKTDSEDKKSFTVKTENAEKPSDEDAASRDREQDIWALVHVARYMPDDGDWNDFVRQSLQGVLNPKVRADQADRLKTARRRAKGFEERLVAMMAHLEEELDFGTEALQSSWDEHTNLHHLQGALRMRAANKIYEDKLLQVKQLRSEIAALREAAQKGEAVADPMRLGHLVSRLDGELSMAQLYANEVYGSGGATVHAVMGMQVKAKLEGERKHAVKAIIPKQQWLQTFTDNLGDVLKDFEHFGRAHYNLYEEETAAEVAEETVKEPAPGAAHPAAPKRTPRAPRAHDPHHEPDYWYAAFKMGKYADRMVDALPYLRDGSPDDLITGGDALELDLDPKVKALRELATLHKTEKKGAAKDDPLVLKRHPYFGAMTQGKVAKLRQDAIDLGVLVRKMVATTAAAQPVPDKLDGAKDAPAKARPVKRPPTPEQQAAAAAVVNQRLLKLAAAAQEARAAAEQAARAPEAAPAPS